MYYIHVYIIAYYLCLISINSYFSIASSKDLKTSMIYKYCDSTLYCKDKNFIKKLFYPTIAELKITDVKLRYPGVRLPT